MTELNGALKRIEEVLQKNLAQSCAVYPDGEPSLIQALSLIASIREAVPGKPISENGEYFIDYRRRLDKYRERSTRVLNKITEEV